MAKQQIIALAPKSRFGTAPNAAHVHVQPGSAFRSLQFRGSLRARYIPDGSSGASHEPCHGMSVFASHVIEVVRLEAFRMAPLLRQ
jgi:hypothetical protein